ncbi:MAG TPA: hypothetical protein VM557_09455 [Thermoanaerobaculia bacterium]|nr:hypothetical protein [Thermoanaerobaculia bacterium]
MVDSEVSKDEGIRWSLLYGVAISLLLEYGILQFYLTHPGRFTIVEDYVQFGLVTLLAIIFGVIGIRYLSLFIASVRGRD